MAVIIRRLEESDDTDNFDSGDAPLNNYLNKYAWVNQEKTSIGVTYVAVEEAVPGRWDRDSRSGARDGGGPQAHWRPRGP